MTEAQPATQRQFLRAAVLGSLTALAIDLLLLVGPEGSLTTDGGILGAFFDVQARALLDGNLAVPPEAVGFEGFVTDGATYEYFGPVLALVRLPLLVVTDALDGRLTQLSMLLALVVLLAATAGLHWRLRGWLRPEGALAPRELTAVALLQVAVGAGSIVAFLIARPVVYHETELWGAALAVTGLWAVLGVLVVPSGGRVALAGLVAVLTINTRVSVGLVPLLALGVAAVVLATGRPTRRGPALGLVLAALAALASSAAINQAKFDRPFGIPIERQVASQIDPARRAALAANDGTIFGRQFVWTTLLAAARPDAVGTARGFPWIGLPQAPPTVLGDVRFDTLQRSLSAPTSMALLCLLSLVGLAGALRLPGRRRWAVLGLLGAAAAGYAGALSIAYVTSRYLADALPLLVLGAALGVQELARGGRLGRGAIVAGGVLVVAGVAINGGAGLLEQRLSGSTVPEAQRAAWVRTQDRVDAALGRTPRGISAGAALPARGSRRVGDLAVVGRCDGLYVLDAFGAWAPVERTQRTGRLVLDVRGGALGREEALAVIGRGGRRVTLVARAVPGGLRLAVRAARRDQPLAAAVPAGAAALVELSFEPGLAGQVLAVARVDGRDAAAVGLPRVPAGEVRLGQDPEDLALGRFTGRVGRIALRAPVCERVARRAGLLEG